MSPLKFFLHLLFEPLFHALRHRSIVRGFLGKEIGGRYAGSYAGMVWIILEPLATILIFSFVFTYVFRVSLNMEMDGTASFTVFFLAGYFPWLMLSEALSRGAGSIVGNSTLVTKVIFPVDLLPLSSVLSSFLIHGVGFGLYLIYLAMIGKVSATWLMLPVLFLLHAVFCCGLSFLVSALVVFIRDVQQALGLFLMVWFYASPVLYPMRLVPEPLRQWIWLNPMSSLIVPFREALLRGMVPWKHVMGFAGLALVSYALGAWFFMRSKRAFADVL
ncbi:MAG: ABC transporter permease [Desulfosoma sp.]